MSIQAEGLKEVTVGRVHVKSFALMKLFHGSFNNKLALSIKGTLALFASRKTESLLLHSKTFRQSSLVLSWLRLSKAELQTGFNPLGRSIEDCETR